MRKTLKLLLLAVMLLVMVGVTMLVASAEGPFEVGNVSNGQIAEGSSFGTYPTLADAVDAVAANQDAGANGIVIIANTEIVLDRDLTTTATIYTKHLTEITVSIDARGYTLTAAGVTCGWKGKVTFIGGNFSFSGSYPIRAYGTGYVDVQGGNYTFSKSGCYGVYTSAETDETDSIIIRDGVTITSKGVAVYVSAGRRIRVEGGTFTGTDCQVHKNGLLTIVGGNFTLSGRKQTVNGSSTQKTTAIRVVGKADIQGGTFNTGAKVGILVEVGAQATITGGKLICSDSGAFPITLNNGTAEDKEYCMTVGGSFELNATQYSIVLYAKRKAKVEGGSYTGHVYNSAGTLDISGGTFKINYAQVLLRCAGAGATFNVSGGNFTANAGKTLISDGSNKNCKLNISGGTFNTPAGSTAAIVSVGNSTSTCNISGGTFVSDATGIACINNIAGKMTITGGKFTSATMLLAGAITLNGGTFTVKNGGKLTADYSTLTIPAAETRAVTFVYENYTDLPASTAEVEAFANANWKTVLAAMDENGNVLDVINGEKTVAKIAVAGAEAVTAYLANHQYIKLDTNFGFISRSITVAKDGVLTLNFADKVTAATTLVVVEAGGKLIIANGEFEISNTSDALFVLQGGELEIQKGTFTATDATLIGDDASSTVTIKDGTFNLQAPVFNGTVTIETGKFVFADAKGALTTPTFDGDVTIKNGDFTGRGIVIHGHLEVEAGKFTFERRVSISGTANILGGNWTFTDMENGYGFVLAEKTADTADKDYTVTIGAGVYVNAARYAVVLYPYRQAKIEGGEYYGCLYVDDGSKLYIQNGTFVNDDTHSTGSKSVIQFAGAGTHVVIENGNFTARKDSALVINYAGKKLDIQGGTFNIKDGATFISDLTDVTFTKGENGPHFVIGKGSNIPSETLTGYNGQYANATWEIQYVTTIQIDFDLTVTALADFLPYVVNGLSLYITSNYDDIIPGENCTVANVEGQIPTTVVVSGGTLTLAMAEALEVTETLVVVRNGGNLVIDGGEYTAAGTLFESLAGSTVTIKDGTFNFAEALNVNGTVTIEKGKFTVKSISVNNGGKLYVTEGEFTVTSTSTQNAFVINIGGFANIQGGNWNFTYASSWCFRVATQSDAEQADSDDAPSLILGENVKKLSKNSYAFVVQPNRKALVEGGEYYGRVYVSGTLEIDGGTFTHTGTLIFSTNDSGFHGNVTIDGGKFTAPYIGVGELCGLTVTSGEFTLAGDTAGIALSVLGTATISGGEFALNGTLNCTAAGSFTISGGNFVADGGFALFASARELTVAGGTFTMRGGATLASALTGITFEPESREDLTFVIGAGSTLPSEDLDVMDGYDSHYANATWIIKSWDVLSVATELTISSIDDYYAACQAIVEEAMNLYMDIMLDDNCTIDISEWAPIVVMENGKLIMQNINLSVSNTLVTVQAGGELLLVDSIFTATSKLPFIVLEGGSVTLNNVKATVETFMSGTAGTLNVLDLFLIVKGEDDVIFDVPAAITKVVVVANTKNMMDGVTLSNYVKVRYGGKTLNAWVKLPATAENATTMKDGASIEVSTLNKSGLRFISTVSETLATYLKNTYTSGETFIFGTLIAPADYVAAAGGFTIEKLSGLAVNIPYVDIEATWESEGGTMVDNTGDGIPDAFSGALINLKSYTRAYAAVSYVKVVKANDEVAEMIYGAFDSTVNARSAEEIANELIAAKDNPESPYYVLIANWDAEWAIVDKYAGKVAE